MALVEGKQAEMKPIESPAALFDHLHRIGVHLSIERIWWQAEDKTLLRVRDPNFRLTQAERRAIAFWEADLRARVSEWIGATSALPSTWRHPYAPVQGVMDEPNEAIIGAEASHIRRVDRSGRMDSI